MEKRNAVIVLLLTVFMQATHVQAQQWLLDFGSATGTHTSGESNSFLPSHLRARRVCVWARRVAPSCSNTRDSRCWVRTANAA